MNDGMDEVELQEEPGKGENVVDVVEAPTEVIPPNIEEMVNPQLILLEEKAGIEIPPEAKQQIYGLIHEAQVIGDEEQRQGVYDEFLAEHPDLVLPLDQLEAAQEMILHPGVDEEVQENDEDAQEIEANAEEIAKNTKDNAEKSIINGLSKSIKDILTDDKGDPQQKEAQVREELQKKELSPGAIQQIIDGIKNQTTDENREQQVKELIDKSVKADPRIAENAIKELDEVKGLMKKIEGLGKDQTKISEYKSLYQSMTKASDDLLEDVPMEDFIDLVFATGHGYGGFGGGGRYERWREDTEDVKEKETLSVLGEIFDKEENPDGAKEFFAKLTDVSPSDVFSDQSLLKNIESILNKIETSQDPKEARDEVKKKIAEGALAAGKKLDVEKINLSQDVLRYILMKAKESLRKQ